MFAHYPPLLAYELSTHINHLIALQFQAVIIIHVHVCDANHSVHTIDSACYFKFAVQLWLSVLTFVYGFLMDGAIAVIGLCAMEIVPKSLAGSAHGMACAVAQGNIKPVCIV